MDIRKIDLHIHTNASDGTDTPDGLLDRVREAGIPIFSVTDHDTAEGNAAVRRLLKPADPALISGVEFSCRDERGEYHILGYGFVPDSPPVLRLAETGHMNRMKKLRFRLDALKSRFGIVFSPGEAAELFTHNNPGKPHIAKLLVSHGLAESIGEAIAKYLNGIKSPDLYIRPEAAIAAVRASGGIAVLAHPLFGNGSQSIRGEDLERRVRRLMDHGLRGLEGFYSGYTEADRTEVLALAERLGLYVTAGSDYHGGAKTVVLGDTGLSAAEEIPRGLIRFLEDAL